MTDRIKILMVEDDPNLGYLLRENFLPKGLDILLCADGEEGLDAFRKDRFDICILDVMMPKKDGLAVAKEIRKSDKQVPIIFLTAKNTRENIYEGFSVGADDYLTKPFDAQELFLRIMAILKRTNAAFPTFELKCYQLASLSFDFTNRTLKGSGEPVRLSQKEAELLRIFCEHEDELLSRKIILQQIWGRDDYFTSNSMDVYLTKLRKILKAEPRIEIKNLHGTGFRLMVQKEPA